MKVFESTFPKDFRKEEIKRILDFVVRGKFCQLVCVPGDGKATILRLLAHNRNVLRYHLGEKEKPLRFIYLNLFELTSYEEAQIAKFLLLALDQKTPRPDDSLVLTKQLGETVNKLAEQGQTVVFLFDHFDEYQNRLPRSFFQMLKSINSLAKYKFATVFATRRDLFELVDEQIAKDFWNFFVGNTIYLKIYDQEAAKFMFSQLEKVFAEKFTDKQKKEIIGLTGGHAKLTKIISELTLSENITLEKDSLLQNHQVRATLFEIWLFLTAQEQRTLYFISKGKLPAETNVQENLTKLDLINEKLTFTVPLFGHFVKSLPADIAEPKIIYSPKTKEIIKGESILSELLSSQEYRLMRFLIENQGRVVERDELIEAVWPHAQVAEAISDEAIDQMIFRLRKKIEQEPANPKHLITVKGRGIRFEP